MEATSTEVQNNFGKYLKFAEANEVVTVTRNGKAVAKIVPCDELPQDVCMESAAEYRAGGDWVTYEEFLELTEASEQRFELIDGVVFNLASPTFRHQYIVNELHVIFYNWFKGMNCTTLTSPFDITLKKSDDNICVVQPDIIVICDRNNRNNKDKYMGTPALVIEVLSPSTRSKDMVKKLDLYMRCGVKEYWIIDPINELVNVYAMENQDLANNVVFKLGADHFAKSIIFEGLHVDIRELFQ